MTRGILEISGFVQHYEWGGHDFIPGLIGIPNPNRKPFAELWLGAHPGGPCRTHGGGTLESFIAAAPETILGAEIAARFHNRLPYLLKVLDAGRMLSIQAHPSKRQAEEGFARENAAGIPLTAAHRNYKDDNHKPEVHVALTDLWMLHGFRILDEILQTLEAVPELRPLAPFATSVRRLYESLMTMPQPQVDALLTPLIARLERERPASRNHPDYWALRAAQEFPLPGGHRDRGIFSIYLLNLIHLRAGQGTFQPAGVLHAYLEGANVELMANSDNVLRGGLTPKYVDIGELMRTLSFASGVPEILNGIPVSTVETAFRTPAEEFELRCIGVAGGQTFSGTAHGPDTLLVLEGACTLSTGAECLSLARGCSALIPNGLSYRISGEALVYRACLPTA